MIRVHPPGSLVGVFTILELLGQGGMGAVYRARHGPSGTLVALKLIALDEGEDDEVHVARLRREARTAASIAHPHVTRVLDAGIQDGTPFIAYELVTGGTLRSALKARQLFPWPEAVALAKEIASALEAIHASGLVHRDLKPDNVLLDASGRTKLSDFGLVRRRVAGSASLALTKPGEILGTFAYMAPEQGDDAEVDARADLYSFGILLYELLTGTVPFKGVGITVLKKHLMDSPVPPRTLVPGIPPALDALVLALLAKAKEDRPQTAAVVGAALDGVGTEGEPKPLPRRSWLLVPIVALALAGAGLAWRSRDSAAPTAGASDAIAFTASDLLLRARDRIARGELGLALLDLDHVVTLEPRSIDGLQERGILRARLGDAAGARADQVTALDLAARKFIRCDQAGDVAGALAAANRMVAIDPGNPEGFSCRASLRARMGEGPAAIEDASAAIRIRPDARFYEQRCVLRRQAQNHEGAIDDGTQWIRGAPGNAIAYLMRGASYYDRTRDFEALADLDKAIALDPRLPDAYFYRAHARGRAGDRKGAVADAKHYLELRPEGPGSDPMKWVIKTFGP